MIADLVLDGVAARIGENHRPGQPCIAAPPKGSIARINHPRVYRIEGKHLVASAQIEHVPRQTVIVSDISAGHVGMLDHEPSIVWADRRCDRCAAAPRSNHLPTAVIRRLGKAGQRGKEQCQCQAKYLVHRTALSGLSKLRKKKGYIIYEYKSKLQNIDREIFGNI